MDLVQFAGRADGQNAEDRRCVRVSFAYGAERGPVGAADRPGPAGDAVGVLGGVQISASSRPPAR
jgi:hypothetical protein